MMSAHDEQAWDSLSKSIQNDTEDSQRQISRLRSKLNEPLDISGVDESSDQEGSLEDENTRLRRELARMRLREREYESEKMELEDAVRDLELKLNRMRAREAHRSLARASVHPSRDVSAHGMRDNFLKTKREQERLDQKLQRAMQEANDVALRNDALMAENAELRQEVSRLRQENTDLLLFAKDSQTDSHVLRAQVATNVSHRAQLLRRLDRTQRDKGQLEGNLSSLANQFVRSMQEEQMEQEMTRWSKIATPGSIPRARGPRPLRPPSRTRNIRVEDW